MRGEISAKRRMAERAFDRSLAARWRIRDGALDARSFSAEAFGDLIYYEMRIPIIVLDWIQGDDEVHVICTTMKRIDTKRVLEKIEEKYHLSERRIYLYYHLTSLPSKNDPKRKIGFIYRCVTKKNQYFMTYYDSSGKIVNRIKIK